MSWPYRLGDPDLNFDTASAEPKQVSGQLMSWPYRLGNYNHNYDTPSR